MSLVKNLSESERIQKVKDRMLYANYTINQIQTQGGCNPYPTKIQSGSGSSGEASAVIQVHLGEVYTSIQERAIIIANNSCQSISNTNSVIPLVTNGSLLFNGTTSQLLYSGITVGNQPFTFEGWFNLSGNLGNRNVIFGAKYVSPNHGEFSFAITGTNSFSTDQLGVDARTYIVPTMSLNTWYHFAVCRDLSAGETVFLNGVRSSDGVKIDIVNYQPTRYIGVWDSGGTGLTNYFTGQLAGLRVVVGSYVYGPASATITVPTQPLANIPNTVLLMNTPTGVNYLADTSSSAFTFTNTDVTSSAARP